MLPRLTLGWQILGWTAEYLLQPDGPKAGEPWKFTNEQARLVLWWYEIDRQGRFTERYGMLRRMKGWGKDPFAAALCSVEFVGPCRFGGWNGKEPFAIPHSAAWVQTAAVSKDQTRNTMTLFPGMLSPRAVKEFSIDLGKEIIYGHHGRCRIEAVTSSPRALEGPRATFTVKNETHHWLKPNEGIEMAAVIARNAAKARDGSSRVLAISNAHSPGEGSDAEHDYEAYEQIRDGLKPQNGWFVEDTLAPNAIRDIEETELGFFLEGADGKLVYEDRHHRLKAPHQTSQLTVSDAAGSTYPYLLSVKESDRLQEIFNDVRVAVSTFSVGVLAVLWTLTGGTPTLVAGESRSLWAQYPNASSGGAYVDTWMTPAVGTDVTQIGVSDADIGVAVSKFARTMKITLTNNHASRSTTLTLLQARGTPVSHGNPTTVSAEDAASQSAYGVRTFRQLGKYHANTNEAQAFCDHIVSKWKDPQSLVTLPFDASINAIVFVVCFSETPAICTHGSVTAAPRGCPSRKQSNLTGPQSSASAIAAMYGDLPQPFARLSTARLQRNRPCSSTA